MRKAVPPIKSATIIFLATYTFASFEQHHRFNNSSMEAHVEMITFHLFNLRPHKIFKPMNADIDFECGLG